ncbi:MAG: tetratricopeptide repeat protein [Treponema bryantii]|nr:tetratricopeptide repeat protein [Treponema bryantii]
MRKFLKNVFSFLFLLGLSVGPCFSSETGSYAFVEGCKSFSLGDWENAIFMLKKAVAYEDYETPDTYYMLITSEVEAGEYKAALNDCDYFLKQFPSSIYISRVTYLKGKILFNLKEYDKSVVVLSDFCHQYKNDDMYSYALFYIAESLYENYKYDEAESIYERIVQEFPNSPKFAASQYRIESILQRSREEKLLYLLKQTGEEYLAAKEDYERQLRLYNSNSVSSAKDRLHESQQKNAELESYVKDLEKQIAELQNQLNLQYEKQAELQKEIEINSMDKEVPSFEPYDETKERIKALKEKAQKVQNLLDEN